jgi:hypothetical protein
MLKNCASQSDSEEILRMRITNPQLKGAYYKYAPALCNFYCIFRGAGFFGAILELQGNYFK